MRKCAAEPYEGDKSFIFVSYCHKDKGMVYPIIEQMARDGYRIWYDEGINPGSEWPEVIADHLNRSDSCIAFVSENALHSHNCRREINFALMKKKPFLTIFIEDVKMSLGMEMQLSAIQSIFKYTYNNLDDFAAKLYATDFLEESLGEPNHAIDVSAENSENNLYDMSDPQKTFSDSWFVETVQTSPKDNTNSNKGKNTQEHIKKENKDEKKHIEDISGAKKEDVKNQFTKPASEQPCESRPVKVFTTKRKAKFAVAVLIVAVIAAGISLLVNNSNNVTSEPYITDENSGAYQSEDADLDIQWMGEGFEKNVQDMFEEDGGVKPLNLDAITTIYVSDEKWVMGTADEAEKYTMPREINFAEIENVIHFTSVVDLSIDNSAAERLQDDSFDCSVLEKLPQLTSLSLINCGVSDVNVCSGLPQLTNLSLQGNIVLNVDDISDFTQLKSLDLSDNHIENINSVVWPENIESLNLSGNGISDIMGLSEVSTLRELNLSNNFITDTIGVSELEKIIDLNLANNGITNIYHLSELAQLKKLNLDENQIYDLNPLSKLVELEELYLAGIGMDRRSLGFLADAEKNNISFLSNLTKLQRLDMSERNGYGLYLTDIDILSGLTNLTTLNLSGNLINDISPLAGLAKLEVLLLYNNLISDIAPIANLTNLEILYIAFNGIEDISILSGMSELKELVASHNQIMDITPLSGLTNLSILEIGGNKFSDITPISNLHKLTRLYLSGEEILDIGMLSGLTQLVELEIILTNVSDIEALSGMVNLEKLLLNSNNISDIAPLADITGLKILELSGNFGINDIKVLSDMKQLEELDLSYNGISNVEPLSALIELRILDLSNNEISDVEPLSGLYNLTKLDLTYNDIINPEAILELSQAADTQIILQ